MKKTTIDGIDVVISKSKPAPGFVKINKDTIEMLKRSKKRMRIISAAFEKFMEEQMTENKNSDPDATI